MKRCCDQPVLPAQPNYDRNRWASGVAGCTHSEAESSLRIKVAMMALKHRSVGSLPYHELGVSRKPVIDKMGRCEEQVLILFIKVEDIHYDLRQYPQLLGWQRQARNCSGNPVMVDKLIYSIIL